MGESNEIWKPIAGFEGHYEASDRGRIRSLKRRTPYVLSEHSANNGYLTVMISMGGRCRPYGVHRLVMLAFHGEPPDGYHACHYDGDKTNNRLDNLRWDNAKGNAADQLRHGRHRNKRKTHCKRGHEFTPENTYIQPSRPDIRRCQTCQDAANEAVRKIGPWLKPGARPKVGAGVAKRMVQLRSEGWTFRRIAEHFDVSETCAYKTIQRNS